MRRYDDPVDVRRGQVGEQEAPEQFLWRGRLWKVRAVLGHWVETGAWWASADVRAVVGSDEAGRVPAARRSGADLLAEREFWRVEAGIGAHTGGVFDLAFSWDDGCWQLVGCAD